jgi:signal peptidase I
MEPTLENGDIVLVNKIRYTFHEPERFDLIAFQQREGDNSYYNVKRVIGLPGETISIQDGYVFVDGVVLANMPFDEKIATEGLALDGVTLSDGEYFVLGDNVNNSEDSRFANMGNILENEILGKVIYRWLPREKRGAV